MRPCWRRWCRTRRIRSEPGAARLFPVQPTRATAASAGRCHGRILMGVESNDLTAAQLDALIAFIAPARDYCAKLAARCAEPQLPETDWFTRRPVARTRRERARDRASRPAQQGLAARVGGRAGAARVPKPGRRRRGPGDTAAIPVVVQGSLVLASSPPHRASAVPPNLLANRGRARYPARGLAHGSRALPPPRSGGHDARVEMGGGSCAVGSRSGIARRPRRYRGVLPVRDPGAGSRCRAVSR
jgi:hypothetical protein